MLFQVMETLYSQLRWVLMTTIQFRFSENSDVLSVLVDESGITTDNGWLIKPRCLPLEVKVLSNLMVAMNIDNNFGLVFHADP